MSNARLAMLVIISALFHVWLLATCACGHEEGSRADSAPHSADSDAYGSCKWLDAASEINAVRSCLALPVVVPAGSAAAPDATTVSLHGSDPLVSADFDQATSLSPDASTTQSANSPNALQTTVSSAATASVDTAVPADRAAATAPDSVVAAGGQVAPQGSRGRSDDSTASATAALACTADTSIASAPGSAAPQPANPVASPESSSSPSPRDPGSAPAVQSAIAEPSVAPYSPQQQPSPDAVADNLEELQTLLAQAQRAVALLEAAVARQERRIVELTAASAGGLAADPAGALLRNLGVDPDTTSAAARFALQEALQQVLRERRAAGGEGAASASASSGLLGNAVGAGGGGSLPMIEGGGEWFGRHFALRSALRVIDPPAWTPVAGADAADPGMATATVAATAAPVVMTCAFVHELPHPNAAAVGGGPLQYIVAGDASGTLYLLSPADGSVLASLPSGTDSPVTACSAYSGRKHESTVVTGHANGQTRSFAILVRDQQPEDRGAGAGGGAGAAAPPSTEKLRQRRRDSASGAGDVSTIVVQSVTLRHVVAAMPPAALPWAAVEELVAPAAAAADAVGVARATPAVGAAAAAGAAETLYTGPPAPIMHILPYRLANKPNGRRMVAVIDRAGNLRLDRENGTARFFARTNRTQMAVHFVGTYLVMLSPFHATILNTLQPRPPRAFTCQHLNGSRLLAASFDGHRPFRGYGINTRGELLSMVTPHEGGITLCKVHRATPLPWLGPERLAANIHALSLTPLRGYLLLTHGSTRVLFNVSGTVRHGIPTLTAVTDEHVASIAKLVAAATAPPLPPATPEPAPENDRTSSGSPSPSPPPTSAWAASGGLINGVLPPPPVVAVAPGSQLVVLGLAQPASTAESAVARGGAATAEEASEGPPTSGAMGGMAFDGLLVVLESKMPAAAFHGGASKIWSQPIFLGAMVLVGLYQFWRMSSNRTQRRIMPARGPRGRRGYGGYGAPSYGNAADYMYGEGRVPPQPRSALRRGRNERPVGRSVNYVDDDDY